MRHRLGARLHGPPCAPKATSRTRIGVAFQNLDQSWNLRFDFIPARMGETTIQLRPFDAKPEEGAAEPEPAPEPAPPRAQATGGRAPRK